MDSIFEEFCKTGDIRWRQGLVEHWLSVLEGVWRVSEGEDRFLEIPSSNTKYFLRHTYLEIYAVLEALWRGDSGRESPRPVLSAFITGTPGIGKTVFGSYSLWVHSGKVACWTNQTGSRVLQGLRLSHPGFLARNGYGDHGLGRRPRFGCDQAME
jgi:hypothetical protein